MRLKNSQKAIALIVISMVTVVSLQIINHNTLKAENTAGPLSEIEVNSGLPIRLKIPKINVDAHIESVGLINNSEMDIPKDITHAAWFNRGPRPGENGNAVIDGHFGWKDGMRAAFDDLGQLENGDKIYVEDDQGVVTTFIVREVRKYSNTEDASGVFGVGDGGSHLNLITCGGVWDKVEKSYSDRLVVFSDKVIE